MCLSPAGDVFWGAGYWVPWTLSVINSVRRLFGGLISLTSLVLVEVPNYRKDSKCWQQGVGMEGSVLSS